MHLYGMHEIAAEAHPLRRDWEKGRNELPALLARALLADHPKLPNLPKPRPALVGVPGARGSFAFLRSQQAPSSSFSSNLPTACRCLRLIFLSSMF